MNISSLSVKMMVNTSRVWLDDDELRAQLEGSGSHGKGVLEELEGAHASLAGLSERRRMVHERLRAVIDFIVQLDSAHDRQARGLYYALDALIELSKEEQELAAHQRHKAQLSAMGLRVVRLPFVEEGGAAEELARSVRKELASVTVGERDLQQVFDAKLLGATRVLDDQRVALVAIAGGERLPRRELARVKSGAGGPTLWGAAGNFVGGCPLLEIGPVKTRPRRVRIVRSRGNFVGGSRLLEIGPAITKPRRAGIVWS